MTTKSLGSVVLILFVFSLIHLFLTLSIGLTNIEKNWDKYKCNPGIIPFAGMFGRDPVETSRECIQLTQVNFMSAFIEPIYESIGFLVENGNFFSNIFSNMNLFGNNLQSQNFQFFDAVEVWFQGMSSELTITFNNFLNIFTRASNVFTNFGAILQSSTSILTSSMDELPFVLVRMVQ